MIGPRGNGSTAAPALRPGRAPIVVVSSVVALAVLTSPAYWLLTDPELGDATPVVLAFFAPGSLMVLSWLVRLVHWRIAAGATGSTTWVTAHLAQSPQPHARGRVIGAMSFVGRLGGATHSQPKGYAVWLTMRDPDGAIRYQRVVWEPWLRELTGPRQATVLRGSGPISVIDVHGLGRLWPASFTLRRYPYRVRLTPFSRAHKLPKENSLTFGYLAYLFAILVMPCVSVVIVEADWAALAWWVAYLVAFMTCVGTWFGIIPPGALPRAEP